MSILIQRWFFVVVLACFAPAVLAQEKAPKNGEPIAEVAVEKSTKESDESAQPRQETTEPGLEKPAQETPKQATSDAESAKSGDDKKAEEKKTDEKPTDSKKSATQDKSAESKEPKSESKPAAKPEASKLEASPEHKKPVPTAELPKLPNIGASDTPMLPGQPWRVHDIRRPRPVVVTPGELSTYDKPGTAPSDAVVLFDGTDLSNWAHVGPDGPDDLRVAQWKVENGYVEVVPRTGTMQTIDSFGSCQLHIEWQSPEKVRGDSQGRGNSGIKLMQVYEVQVLDSYNNRTYADGYAGAMYGQYSPLVNAARKPGEWQVYDLIFEAPKFKADGSVDQPAYLTLIHNGVLLHHRRAYYGPTGGRVVQRYNLDSPAAPITLQDHGNPVRFRNIWIRPLDL